MGLRLIHKINIINYLITAVQLWNNDLLTFSSVNNKRVHSPGQGDEHARLPCEFVSSYHGTFVIKGLHGSRAFAIVKFQNFKHKRWPVT